MYKRKPKVTWKQRFVKEDARLTNLFCRYFNENILSLRSLVIPCKILEVVGHGLIWLLIWIVFAYITRNSDNMKYSLLAGYVLDIIINYGIKGKMKKKRPTSCRTDIFLNYGAQYFAFPSAHVSKACYTVLFLKYVYGIRAVLLFTWLLSMSLSRLLLRRVNFYDIIAALVTGTLSFIVTYFIITSKLN